MSLSLGNQEKYSLLFFKDMDWKFNESERGRGKKKDLRRPGRFIFAGALLGARERDREGDLFWAGLGEAGDRVPRRIVRLHFGGTGPVGLAQGGAGAVRFGAWSSARPPGSL